MQVVKLLRNKYTSRMCMLYVHTFMVHVCIHIHVRVHVIILHACSMCVHVCVWHMRYTYMYMVHVQKLDVYEYVNFLSSLINLSYFFLSFYI